MARHTAETTEHATSIRSASDRWWKAQEAGAPAEVIDTLWRELDHLCRTGAPPPPPEDSAASRFGWTADASVA